MKKLIFLILALFVLLPLSAGYSPSVTLNAGVNTLFYGSDTYYSVRTGVEISIISYRIKFLTLSVPVSISNLTRSRSSSSLLSPSYIKNGAGLEVLLDNGHIGGSIAALFGYEHFTETRAIMKYMELRAGLCVILSPYLSLIVPVSWTYTPQGSEASLSLALKVGGEI